MPPQNTSSTTTQANKHSQPDLIGYDSRPGSLTGSSSYYTQKLFSTHRGATILPVTTADPLNPLYWVASATAGPKPTYFVKLANYGDAPQEVIVRIPGLVEAGPEAKLRIVSGAKDATNRPFSVTVKGNEEAVDGNAEEGYRFEMPAWGAAVLSVPTEEAPGGIPSNQGLEDGEGCDAV